MNVLTMGTFDLLHPGHLSLFRWCRLLAGPDGQVIVTVNSDDFVERYKGHRPVMSQDDRRQMVRAVPGVNYCGIHRFGEHADGTIAHYLGRGPGVIVIGGDWRERDYLGQLGITQEWLDERDIVVVYVPLLEGHSSTALRERVP